jgi:hypothetical protein
MAFTTGRYTAVWNALAVGQTQEGFRISHQYMKRLIQGDKFGETPQDAVMRGMEVLVEARLLEWDAAAIQTLIFPYSNGYVVNSIGKLDVGGSMAKPFILTAMETNPGPTPASQTLGQAILQENFPVNLLFGPDLRDIPIRLRCYPFANGSFISGT